MPSSVMSSFHLFYSNYRIRAVFNLTVDTLRTLLPLLITCHLPSNVSKWDFPAQKKRYSFFSLTCFGEVTHIHTECFPFSNQLWHAKRNSARKGTLLIIHQQVIFFIIRYYKRKSLSLGETSSNLMGIKPYVKPFSQFMGIIFFIVWYFGNVGFKVCWIPWFIYKSVKKSIWTSILMLKIQNLSQDLYLLSLSLHIVYAS